MDGNGLGAATRNIHGMSPGENGIQQVHDHSGNASPFDPSLEFADGGLATKKEDSKAIRDRELQDFWMQFRKQKGYQMPTATDDGTLAPIDYSDSAPPELTKFAKGGLAAPTEVPPGALPSEVQDNLTAKISPGEFTLPADVVRYVGLKSLMKLRDDAKKGLMAMQEQGQIQEAPAENTATMPASGAEKAPGFAAGGLMAPTQEPQLVPYTDPTTGRMGYHYVGADGKPITGDPVAVPQMTIPNVTVPNNTNLNTGEPNKGSGGNGNGGNGGGQGTSDGSGNAVAGFFKWAQSHPGGTFQQFQQSGAGLMAKPTPNSQAPQSQMPSAQGSSVESYGRDHGGGSIGTNAGDSKSQQARDFANANVAAQPSAKVAANMAGIVGGMATGPMAGLVSTGIKAGLGALQGDDFGDAFNTPGPRLSPDAVQRVQDAYMTGGLSLANDVLGKERDAAMGRDSMHGIGGGYGNTATAGGVSRGSSYAGGSNDAAMGGDNGGDGGSGGAAADHGGGGIGSGRGPGGGGQGDNAGF